MLWFIPEQYKLLFAFALFAVVLAIGVATGVKVEEWKLTAGYAAQLAADKQAYGTLALKTQDANHAVDLLKTQAADADDRRKMAETYALQLTQSLDKKIVLVKASKAVDCKGVLMEAWK